MKSFSNQQVQRYSIRKYSLGAVSVLVGVLFFMGAHVASADEITTQTAAPTTVEIVQEKSTNGQVISTQETKKEVDNTQTNVDSVAETDKEALTESVEKKTEQSKPNLEQSNQNQSIISEETEAKNLAERTA